MQFGFSGSGLAPTPLCSSFPPAASSAPATAPAATPSARPAKTCCNRSTGVVINSDYRLPTAHNFSAQFEYRHRAPRAIRSCDWATRAGVGRNLFRPQASAWAGSTSSPAGRLPVAGFAGRLSGGIFVLDPTNTSSSYNAFVAEPLWSAASPPGLQFRFKLRVFGENLDDSSGGIRFPVPNNSFNNSSLDIPLLRAQDPYNTRNDRSVAATNAPHIINLSGLYDLPFGAGKRWASGGGWKDHVVGGWNINGLARFRSGFPLAVPMGIGNAFDLGTRAAPSGRTGLPAFRSSIRTGPARTPGAGPYINPRAFAVPEPGRLGRRSAQPGRLLPWVNTIDMSVFKRFTPFEDRRRYFELRAEVFNVLNLEPVRPEPEHHGPAGRRRTENPLHHRDLAELHRRSQRPEPLRQPARPRGMGRGDRQVQRHPRRQRHRCTARPGSRRSRLSGQRGRTGGRQPGRHPEPGLRRPLPEYSRRVWPDERQYGSTPHRPICAEIDLFGRISTAVRSTNAPAGAPPDYFATAVDP
jgi:hypothetical protein